MLLSWPGNTNVQNSEGPNVFNERSKHGRSDPPPLYDRYIRRRRDNFGDFASQMRGFHTIFSGKSRFVWSHWVPHTGSLEDPVKMTDTKRVFCEPHARIRILTTLARAHAGLTP